MLHSHLQLNTTVIRRTSGRNLGTFQKRCFFGNLGDILEKYFLFFRPPMPCHSPGDQSPPVNTARLGLCWVSGERRSCRTVVRSAWSLSLYAVQNVVGGKPGNFRTRVMFLRESGSDKRLELLHCSLSLFKVFSSRPTRRSFRHSDVSITLLLYRTTLTYLARQ